MKLSLAAILVLTLSGGAASAASTGEIKKELTALLRGSTARVEFAGADGAASSCSGVLVAPNVLLTAAHCWGGVEESRGAGSVSFHGAEGKAANHRRSDAYAGKEANDLALLAFTPEATERSLARPSSSLDGMKKGAVLIVGSGGPGASGKSDMAQTAELVVARVDAGKGLAYAAVKDGSCWKDGGSPAFLLTDKRANLVGVVARPAGADCKGPESVTIALLASSEAWLAKSIPAVAAGKTAGGGSTWGGTKPPP